MDNLNKFKKTLIAQMLVTAALTVLVAIMFGALAVAAGFALGSFFSILNFHLMFGQIAGRLGMERKAATVQSGFGLLVRLALMGAPLYLAITYDGIDPIAAAVGLFNLQISVVIYGQVLERFGLLRGLKT